jgi:pimeloyl-ACP methyl ester carboxylesterase
VRLLDHLKIDKAHVVGYSMGAEIAGHLLVLHPDRLLSATLGGGGPAFERTEESRAREELAAAAEGNTLSPEIGDAISQMIIGSQDQKALAASVRGGMTLEVTAAQLQANRVPVLVIYGSNDGARANRQRLDRIAEQLHAQRKVIEGGDHLSTLGSPEFLNSVRSFIDSHRAKQTAP